MKLLKAIMSIIKEELEDALPSIMIALMSIIVITAVTVVPTVIISCIAGYSLYDTWNIVVLVEGFVGVLAMIASGFVGIVKKVIRRYKSEQEDN